MLQEGAAFGNSALQAAGHTGKYLGLGNKPGLATTHRHSLEKLKEYESQLLMSSNAAQSNASVVNSHPGGGDHPGSGINNASGRHDQHS